MTGIDLALLLLRVSVGLTIVAHGTNKLSGTGGLEGTTSWFRSLGMRWPRAQALLASATEIVAGLAVLAGLLTPIGCAAIVALMVVAIVTVHWRVGFFIFLPNGGWEYCANLAVAAVVIAVAGPGDISVDHLAGTTITSWWAAATILIGLALAATHLFISLRQHETPDNTPIL